MQRSSVSKFLESVWGYARLPAPLPPLALALIPIVLFWYFREPNDYSPYVTYTLVAVLIAGLRRGPRWLGYALLLLALAIQLYWYTQIIAVGPPFDQSTRDKAAIATARALLRGVKPWNNVAELGVTATTGPASVLFALPAVLLWGNLQWLSFAFWMSVFALCALGDLRYYNSTFPVLAMFFLLDIAGFIHTLQWRLEEFYYPYLFLFFAVVALKRNHCFLAGVLLAIVALFRFNYVVMVGAVLLWYALSRPRPAWGALARIAGGGFVGLLAVLSPFLIIGREDFWQANPMRFALAMAAESRWPAGNFLFDALNQLAQNLGRAPMGLIKLGLTGALLLVTSLYLRRRVAHPFWHVTVAAFLTHTVILFPPFFPMDYALVFVIPAFFAVAYSTLPTAIAK